MATLVGCALGAEQGAANGKLTISGAFAPELLAGADSAAGTMAVYLTIANGGEVDTLDAITTPVAGQAMVHAQMSHGGMTMMMPAELVEVPARGMLRLEPGARHVMLEALTSRPHAGDTIPLTLRFRHAGETHVVVPVIRYAALDSAVNANHR